MLIPALTALCAVLVLAVLVAGVMVRRRYRCARLGRRFAKAVTSGRFDEAEVMAGRWFDATPGTGLRRQRRWGKRLPRLRFRRSRAHLRSQTRPPVPRRSVS